VTPEEWKRKWLNESIASLRELERRCRKAYTNDALYRAATDGLADCHAAAALIYETELSKLGPEG